MKSKLYLDNNPDLHFCKKKIDYFKSFKRNNKKITFQRNIQFYNCDIKLKKKKLAYSCNEKIYHFYEKTKKGKKKRNNAIFYQILRELMIMQRYTYSFFFYVFSLKNHLLNFNLRILFDRKFRHHIFTYE